LKTFCDLNDFLFIL